MISNYVFEKSLFREVFPFSFFHLRSFYAWLFKKIKEEDLKDNNGQFFTMACDVAMMMSMVEMAKDYFMFIQEILYIYNTENPINERKTSRKIQHETSVRIRNNQSKYEPLAYPKITIYVSRR